MNVMMICFCSHDVIEYIVRNYRKDRPRFSLYLSSQLLYGSVKVYKKQTMYLVGKWNANLIEKDYVEMGLRLKIWAVFSSTTAPSFTAVCTFFHFVS